MTIIIFFAKLLFQIPVLPIIFRVFTPLRNEYLRAEQPKGF